MLLLSMNNGTCACSDCCEQYCGNSDSEQPWSCISCVAEGRWPVTYWGGVWDLSRQHTQDVTFVVILCLNEKRRKSEFTKRHSGTFFTLVRVKFQRIESRHLEETTNKNQRHQQYCFEAWTKSGRFADTTLVQSTLQRLGVIFRVQIFLRLDFEGFSE